LGSDGGNPANVVNCCERRALQGTSNPCVVPDGVGGLERDGTDGPVTVTPHSRSHTLA
jgi:hypothetical protein